MSGKWEYDGLIYIPAEKKSEHFQPHLERKLQERVCYSELFGEYIPLSEIINTITTIPRNFLLGFVRNISVALDRDHFSNCSSQLGLAKALAVGELGDRLIEEVEKRAKFFICPRTLASLAKLALAYSSDEASPMDEPTFRYTMIKLCLSIADYMDVAFPDNVESGIESQTDSVEENILRWLIQMSDMTSPQEVVESISRIWAVLNVIPQSETYRKLEPNPNILFKKHNGLSLAEAMVLTESMMVRYQAIDFSSPVSIWSNLVINESSFSATKLNPGRSVDYFQKLIFPIKKLRTKLQIKEPGKIRKPDDLVHSPDKAYFLDFSLLKLFPLINISDNTFYPLFYPFFRWRITEGLYWDIFTLADTKRSIFQSNFGKYFEAYVQSFFKKAFPTLEHFARRIWVGDELKKNDQDPAADIVIHYPDAYIFIEVKSARFKYLQSILLGDIPAIQDDLRIALFEPSEQLNSAINFFCDGKLELDNQKWKGEKIYPVIVTYGMFPNIDPVWNALKKEVRDKGWLDKPHINDLLVLNSFEATLLANLAFCGESLIDIIKDKTSPENDGNDFQSYCYEKYASIARPREVIKAYWDDFIGFARNYLF